MKTIGNMKTIQVAPNLILVNGIAVASSFDSFRRWVLKRKINVNTFRNWPFVDGIYETLPSKKQLQDKLNYVNYIINKGLYSPNELTHYTNRKFQLQEKLNALK